VEKYVNPRYEGKPFLRLLECYVLDAIDHLSDENRKQLEVLSPKLQEIYRCSGNWREIVEQVMHFSPDIRVNITEIWEKNKLVAEELGDCLNPEYFSQIFVDANFSS